MMRKLILIIVILFVSANIVSSETVYKKPRTNDAGQIIEGKWTLMSEEEINKYTDFKNNATMISEETTDTPDGLRKTITIWQRNNRTMTAIHLYDPNPVQTHKGFSPVNVVYVTYE